MTNKIALLCILSTLALACAGESPEKKEGNNVVPGPPPVPDSGMPADMVTPDVGQDTLGADLPSPGDGQSDTTTLPNGSLSFDDVEENNPFAEAIGWAADKGIMTGCAENPPKFCPDKLLTRAAAAATIVRMKYGETFEFTQAPYFDDVGDDHWAFKYVQKLGDDEVTSGCGGDNFCPDKNVARWVGAIFLIRAKYGEDFPYTVEPYFDDVDDNGAAFKYIQKLRDLNVTKGCGDRKFCPDMEMPRAAWAAFLFRLQTL